MQFRLLPAIMIFVGSYLPLTMILLVQDFDYSLLGTNPCLPLHTDAECMVPFRNYQISLPMFVVSLLGLIITIFALSNIDAGNAIDIKSSNYIPTDLMNYTLPYVVSFMGIGYTDQGKFIGLCIFLAWMFWITYKSGQVLLNPVLIAFGWRLYDIEYAFPTSTTIRSGKLISKTQIEPGHRYIQAQVQDLIVVKREA